MSVCGQPFQTIGHEFAQAADIFVFRGQHAYGSGLFQYGLKAGPAAVGAPARSGGQIGLGQRQSFPYAQGQTDTLHNGMLVKIGVGDRGEKIDDQQFKDFPVHRFSFSAKGRGVCADALAQPDKHILKGRDPGFLAAHSAARAALAAGGFLTLEAEHVFHDDSPFIYVGRSALIISLIKGSCGGKRNR